MWPAPPPLDMEGTGRLVSAADLLEEGVVGAVRQPADTLEGLKQVPPEVARLATKGVSATWCNT